MRKRIAGLSAALLVLLLMCSCSSDKKSAENKNDSEVQNASSESDADTTKNEEYLLLCESHYYGNGELAWMNEYSYDVNGKALGEHNTGYWDGKLLYEYHCQYEYDANNLPVKLLFYSDNGEFCSYTEWEYDENGNKIAQRQYTATGELTSSQSYTYDNFNEIIEINDRGKSSSIRTLYEYERNSSGVIERKLEYISDKDHLPAEHVYEYDTHGNIIKETTYEDGVIARWIEYEYFSRKDLISQSFDLTILPDDRNRETAETLMAEMESHYKENGWTAGMIGRCDCENETLSQGYAFYLRDNTTGEIDNSGYFYVVPSTKTIYRIWETEFWIEWMNGLPNQEGNAKELVSSLVNMEPSFSEVNGDRYLILCGEYWFEVSWDCSTVWYVTEPYSDDKGIEIYPNDTNGFLENFHAQSSGTIANNGSQSISTGYTAYDAKIAEYVAATSDADLFFDKYSGDDSSLNSLILGYYHNYSGMTITYALYDVDGNGIPELAFSDTFGIIDIYTLNGDALVKLYENCSFGERSRLHILSGGRLLTEGSNSAFSSSCELSVFSSTGTSLLTQEAYYYDGNGKNPSMDATHTYLTGTDYGNKVNTWLEDSLFDELPWIVIASN